MEKDREWKTKFDQVEASHSEEVDGLNKRLS
jgi:hypothetical protein